MNVFHIRFKGIQRLQNKKGQHCNASLFRGDKRLQSQNHQIFLTAVTGTKLRELRNVKRLKTKLCTLKSTYHAHDTSNCIGISQQNTM